MVDYTVMSDSDIRDFCLKKFKGDAVQTPACIKGALQLQAHEQTLPYSTKPPAPAPAPATSGYCAEGSVCGTPMYGLQAWKWAVLFVTLLLTFNGFERK